jgi:hypothetical protein
VQRAREDLNAVLAARDGGRDRYRQRAAVLEQEISGLAALAEGSATTQWRSSNVPPQPKMRCRWNSGRRSWTSRRASLLGDVLLRIGRPREAAAAYEAARRRTPADAALRRSRGLSLRHVLLR